MVDLGVFNSVDELMDWTSQIVIDTKRPGHIFVQHWPQTLEQSAEVWVISTTNYRESTAKTIKCEIFHLC